MRGLNIILSFVFLLIGLVSGFYIGVVNTKNESNEVKEIQVTKSIHVIHDTIVKQKVIKVEEKQPLIILDSLISDSTLSEVYFLDTVQEQFIEKYKDTLTDDNVRIKTDRIIASKKVKLIYLNDSNIDKDSTIKEILNIKEINNESIIVEFWESPLNYNGYKLSKSKLVVYGLSPQLNIEIYKNKIDYILKTDNIYYKLVESQDFLSLVEIDKPSIIND